jgi:hypothetical protein
MAITSSGGGCVYNNCNLKPVTLREVAMKKITLDKSTMKKITLTAAVATALLFALAAGTAGVPTVHGQSDGSPSKYVSGHHASLSPVW